MKYYQMFHRHNSYMDGLEETLCVWFKWNKPITDENIEKFDKVMWDAMWEQCPPSWRSHEYFTGSQKRNIALGEKHMPQLSWSSIMTRGGYVKVDTPLFKRRKV